MRAGSHTNPERAVCPRRRGRGAVVTGAILSAFAPDPTFEANLRLAEESKQQQVEEDEEGEPKEGPIPPAE